MCLQPATTAGRAETRSPGLLVLSSPGGQKALEPLCQRRSGRGIRKSVAAPKTKKRKRTPRERDRGETSKPPADRNPKPQKTAAQRRSETAEKARRKAPAAKRKQILKRPRQTQFKRQKRHRKTNKRRRALREGKKPTVSCVKT